MLDRLRIASVCRNLPSPANPSSGIFVQRRLEAMAVHADVHVLQPVPYFPFVRPLPDWVHGPPRLTGELRVEHVPMFYLPGVLKSRDATWLAMSIERRIAQMHSERRIDLIDAHFGYPEGAACVAIGKRLGIPVLVTIRGFEQEFAGSSPGWAATHRFTAPGGRRRCRQSLTRVFRRRQRRPG